VNNLFRSSRFTIAFIAMLMSAVLNLAGRLDGGQLTTIYVAAISLFGLTKGIEYLRKNGYRNGSDVNS